MVRCSLALLVIFVVGATCTLATVNENYGCRSDAIGDTNELSVKCMMPDLSDVFQNFSSIPPDRIAKLKVMCDSHPAEDRGQPNSRSSRDLDSLLNNTFGLLRNLNELVVENCQLMSISPLAFNGVSQMKNLTLRSRNSRMGNVALHLSAETFSQLQLLEQLDLSENNINNLPQTLLCPLRRLESLNLTQNNLSDISSVGLSTGNRDNVLCLVDVQKVYLSYNRLKVLTSKGFAAVNQLRELRLDHNLISRAEESALTGLDKLRVLDLSYNQIVALPPFLLRHCEELAELFLHNNSISVLPPGLFSGLHNLLTLDLAHNEIATHWLGSETFADLTRLLTLDISYNRLNSIDSSMFKSQYSLESLRLDHNEIAVISENAFSSLYKLQTLHLSYNRISEITPSTFGALVAMSMLIITNNNIHEIHPDAFHNNSKIMELNLENNKLTEIPVAVQSLPIIHSLDVSYNMITDIHNASYQGLENLYSLVLSGNKIGNVSKSDFVRLPSIRILSLDNNEIETVEGGAFDDVSFLHALRLDSNLLPEVNGLFGNMVDLMMLNISANRIEWFDFALIPVGLQWLDMHDNLIENLGNYFELENMLRLRTLDASHNHIKEIDSSSFPDGIEIVSLNDNHIKLINSFTFVNKPNLTRVDLRRNHLETVDINAFRLTEVRNRKPLPEFSISENPFICDCTMEWIQRVGSHDDSRVYPRMVDIEDLYCNLPFNRFRSVARIVEAKPSDFLCHYKNHCFALCHCCEFDACDCEMACPENCTCFYDQSWNTNIVDCSSQNHISVPLRIPMDVTQLYLDGNDIPSISSHTFIGRKNMRVLYMNNSNVHMINNRTFNGLKSLLVLHLQHNLIVRLHGYEFERLVMLEELYLSHNRIATVGNSTFLHMRSLQVLHLDHNFIVEFQVWNLNQNLKLVDIQLSHNSWGCECQFVGDFSSWLQSRAELVHDIYNVNCVYNGTVSLPLVEFNMTMCTNLSLQSPSYIQSFQVNGFLSIFILAGSLLVVLIIIIALVVVYRKRMSVWFFSKYGVRIFNSDAGFPHDDNKLFDAFLSYSKKDEAFVSQVLAAELECCNPRYRLCLHYRDLPIGGYLSDAIIEAIESSRKTIVILSENFVRSEWCHFEFKSAHQEVLTSGKSDLIVILIGHLSQRDLDPDLRLWLKTCTFLTWGEKKFWDKLRFALPDIRNRKDHRCHVSEHPISVHI